MPDSSALGLGCDLCAVSRMEKAIEKPHFVQRVFTQAERDYLEQKGKGRAQSAAAMFAAKEAVAKALGTGFAGGIAPEQIEVLHDEAGAPHAHLTGKALEKMKEKTARGVLLSLSHEGDMALAVAILY